MTAVATSQQGSGNRSGSDLLPTLIWVATVLVAISWGVRVGTQLSDGYYNSSKVLDKRERLVVLAREKADLTDEVAHARTAEGRDEEVKALFGAGDPRDVLLDVHVKSGERQEPPVVGLGEKTRDSISAGTDTCLRRVRRMRDVWKYWAGRDPLPPPASNESSDADQP